MTLIARATATLLLTLSAVTQAASDNNFAGTIKEVTGQVHISREGTNVLSAQSGMKVLSNDEIATAADGSVGVVLIDGTRLSMGPNTQTRMSDIRFDGTTQSGNILIKLYRGSLRMITGLIAASSPESVRVQTPTSVVGVRGTDFIVEVPQ